MITISNILVAELAVELAHRTARQEEAQRQEEEASRQALIGQFTEFLKENFDGRYDGTPDDLRVFVGGHTFEFVPKRWRDYCEIPAHIQLIKSCPDCGADITGSIVESKEALASVLVRPWFQNHNCGVANSPPPPELTTEERLVLCFRQLIEEALEPVWNGIGIAESAAERASEKATTRAKDLEYQLREQASNLEYDIASARRTVEEAKKSGGSRW